MADERDDRVEITVDEDVAGQRVDRFLRALLSHVPISRVHAMIRKGAVRLGERRARASDRIALGERVSMRLRRDDAERLRDRTAPVDRPNGASLLPVLYEDDHVIALDKPAGMAAHPGSGHGIAETVLGALRARVPVAGRSRPSLVGRLDRDASGVQLAGKTLKGVRALESLSRSGRIGKTYVALVRDRGLPDAGLIDVPLVDAGGGRARQRPAGRSGRPDRASVEASTRYRVTARRGGTALVEVEPRTGRQHQIRAHMSSIDAPLAGDPRYGDRGWNTELASSSGVRRLFLHCSRVQFPDPFGRGRVEISSPLPADLLVAVRALGFRAT
jgi:23S rRNA pseudouridine955/2504/2580 synthase